MQNRIHDSPRRPTGRRRILAAESRAASILQTDAAADQSRIVLQNQEALEPHLPIPQGWLTFLLIGRLRKTGRYESRAVMDGTCWELSGKLPTQSLRGAPSVQDTLTLLPQPA